MRMRHKPDRITIERWQNIYSLQIYNIIYRICTISAFKETKLINIKKVEQFYTCLYTYRMQDVQNRYQIEYILFTVNVQYNINLKKTIKINRKKVGQFFPVFIFTIQDVKQIRQKIHTTALNWPI